MISSTEAHTKIHAERDAKLAKFDEQMSNAAKAVPDVVEYIKVDMRQDMNLVDNAAQDIVAGALVTTSIATMVELISGVDFADPTDDDLLINANREILAVVVELKGHAEHLSQALAELYSRLVEPLAIDEGGYIFPELEPSEAVDKILANVGRKVDTTVDL